MQLAGSGVQTFDRDARRLDKHSRRAERGRLDDLHRLINPLDSERWALTA